MKKGGIHFTGLIPYKGIWGHLFNESFQCKKHALSIINHPLSPHGGKSKLLCQLSMY